MQKIETWPPTYTIYKRINSRWIKDLNISCDTIKVLEENIDRKISDIPGSNIFTDTFPRVRDKKERINKWDFIKLKSLRTAKENISEMKREPTVWENIFASDTSDKALISKVYEELTGLHPRKANNPIKKCAKDLKRNHSVQQNLRSREFCSNPQEQNSYINYLELFCVEDFSILSTYLFNHLFMSVWTHGYLFYTWTLTHYYFNFFLLKLFQLWLLRDFQLVLVSLWHTVITECVCVRTW